MGTEAGTIIVIEDDPHIADLVNLYLRRDGFRVLLAADGDQGLGLVKQEDPWMVILDVGLPGQRDGFDVCREIRNHSNTPVLFLTARDDEVDRILGLELGADDYIVKPFSPRELVARVRAILRRTHEVPKELEIIATGDLEVDLRRREARRGERSSTWPTESSTCWPSSLRTPVWPCPDNSFSTGSGVRTGTATCARLTSTWPSSARSWVTAFPWPRSGALATGSDEVSLCDDD